MATYVIGDIQGCYRTLRLLLEEIGFRPSKDQIWLVGDIVNRGPGSLQALRWAYELSGKGRLTTVLGNHDLHLLAVAEGLRKSREGDTLEDILEARDRDDLLEWLRHRPLLFRKGKKVLVHAGLAPDWDIERAEDLAHEGESALSGRHYRSVLERLNGRPVTQWRDSLTGPDRINAILQVFTRIRTCTTTGHLCLGYGGPPKKAPRGCIPWYQVPGRSSARHTIFFGHWAALGLHIGKRVRALESGCVWGNEMTAYRLKDSKVFQVPCAEPELQKNRSKSRA